MAAVLRGAADAPGPAPASGWTASGVGLGLLSAALAAVFALVALYRDRLPDGTEALVRPAVAALRGPRALRSGHVGDHVAWLVVGVAVLGALVALPLP